MKTPWTHRLLLAACLAAAPLLHAQPATPVKDFDVFVDPPTGFVFVKLPERWQFVGALRPQDLAALPPTVLTSLLPPQRPEPPERVERSASIQPPARTP